MSQTKQFANYNDVLTVAETAALLSISKNTVYALVNHHRLPCRHIGRVIRIRKADVIAFMMNDSE